MDSSGGPPGSALAQRLCGSPLSLIQCDDCTRTMLRLTSGTPKPPQMGVLQMRKRRGEYIDLLIEKKLIDVDALLSRIKNNDAAACATSTSSEPKMKNEECKMKNSQINNECMEKILLQLVGAVMEVGNLLKCILVVLVFFGLAILARMW
ncbi:Phosphatidylinositol-4-phosphate 5-kinase 2 [Hordeum vulgare]|nr:Phosphatidylinositol-4-phosphate 5-kinase 2 [Hordeum vulgare]